MRLLPPPSVPDRPYRFHPAWAVAAATFLVLVLAAAVRSAPSVLIIPLEQEFGWSRAAISGAVSLNILLYGLAGPFAAGLMARYGLRRVVLTALAALIGACLLAAHISRLWQLVLVWGVLAGTGTGVTALVLGATVVHRWFDRYRGTVLGVLTASTATGQLLFLPWLAGIVGRAGWRQATFTLAVALALVVPVVAVFLRSSPRDLGVEPYGAKAGAADPGTDKSRNPFADVWTALLDGCRSKPFWLLAGSFFVCGASTNGLIGTHLIPACVDHGMPEVRAAGLLALMGVCDLVGTTVSGWLSDRLPGQWLLFAYYGLRGLSLMALPGLFDPTAGRLPFFAVFYGLDWIATVPPTVALTARYFGRERVGVMFGWIAAFHQLGAAVEASFAGALRTAQGTYDVAFFVSGWLCVVTAVAVLSLGRKGWAHGGAPATADGTPFGADAAA